MKEKLYIYRIKYLIRRLIAANTRRKEIKVYDKLYNMINKYASIKTTNEVLNYITFAVTNLEENTVKTKLEAIVRYLQGEN